MIDTDKYEGHTPAPWEWIMDDKDTYLSCFVNDHHNNIEADEKLIADAPLLLAEVKRLREQLRLAKEWVAKELSSRAIAEYREYIGDGKK